ncbi:SCO4225 family membrane protein [Streptomyces sp. NPDC054838]
MKILETAVLAWREPVSRVYMALLAVCALWAVAGGIGLGEEWRLPRILAVILTMPWILFVHLFLVVT